MVSQQPGSQDFATLGAEQGGGWGFSPAVLPAAAVGAGFAYPWLRRAYGPTAGRFMQTELGQNIRYPGGMQRPITVTDPKTGKVTQTGRWRTPGPRGAPGVFAPPAPGLEGWKAGARQVPGAAKTSISRGISRFPKGAMSKGGMFGLGGAGLLVDVATDPYGGKVQTAGDYLSTALYGAGAGAMFGPVGAAVGAAGAVTVKGLMDFFGGKKDKPEDPWGFADDDSDAMKKARELVNGTKLPDTFIDPNTGLATEYNDEQRSDIRGMAIQAIRQHIAMQESGEGGGPPASGEMAQTIVTMMHQGRQQGMQLPQVMEAYRHAAGVNRSQLDVKVAEMFGNTSYLQAMNDMKFQQATGTSIISHFPGETHINPSTGIPEEGPPGVIGMDLDGNYVKFVETGPGQYEPTGYVLDMTPREKREREFELTQAEIDGRDTSSMRNAMVSRMNALTSYDASIAGTASRERIADADLAQRANQFASTLEYDKSALGQDWQKFEQGLTQDESQFVRNLAENHRQFEADIGLSKDKFTENKRQFGATFAENQRQFDTQVAQQGMQLEEQARQADAGIARDLNQARQQTSDRMREILQNPADYLARAYAQRGETTPFGEVTQADLINEAMGEYNQYASYLDSLGRGFDAQRSRNLMGEIPADRAALGDPVGAAATQQAGEEAAIAAVAAQNADVVPGETTPETPVDADYIKGHTRGYYPPGPTGPPDPTLTPEQQAAQARDLQLFGEGGPGFGPGPAGPIGPSGLRSLTAEQQAAQAQAAQASDLAMYGQGGMGFGTPTMPMSPEDAAYFQDIHGAAYSGGGTGTPDQRAVEQQFFTGFGPEAVAPGLEREIIRTPEVAGRRKMIETVGGLRRTTGAGIGQTTRRYDPSTPEGRAQIKEELGSRAQAKKLGISSSWLDARPAFYDESGQEISTPVGGWLSGAAGDREKLAHEKAQREWDALRTTPAQGTAMQAQIAAERQQNVLPAAPMRTAGFLAGQGAGEASPLDEPIGPAAGNVAAPLALPSTPAAQESGFYERGGATGFGNPVVVGDSADDRENQELVMSFGGAPVVVLPMTDRQETIMAGAAKKVPRAQIGGLFGGESSFSSLAEKPSRSQFGGQSFGFGMDRPVTQQQLRQRAQGLASPAVRGLFTGKEAAPLRYGFSLFSPQQMGKLTAGERSELSTRLAAENVGLADVEQAIMEQYGTTGARRGRRRF
jgi:hypothetical protein